MLLGEILRLASQRNPRKTAIISGESKLSYADYDDQANRFANFLLKMDLHVGDRVASVLYNTPEYGITHFGNARAGSVLVHISPMYAAPAIAHILDRTRPRVIVADIGVAAKLDQIRDELGFVEHLSLIHI